MSATATATKVVCKHCGSDRGFREVGSARVAAQRDTRSLTIDEAGKVKAQWGFVDCDDFEAYDLDVDYIECRGCGAEGARLEDLAVPEHQAATAILAFEPGDRVVLPDGLRAVVETVDEEAGELTVVGWHETFASSEVARWEP